MNYTTSEFEQAKTNTRGIYEKNALDWELHRYQGLMEKGWLDRFTASIAPGGHLLDLGCGTGKPVARYLIERGFKLTGVDFAPSMIAAAKKNFPDSNWLVQDMRSLDITDSFNGVFSWDGFFHLSAEEQRALIPIFTKLVKPGGALLLTVGPQAGEVLGTVEGEKVYHASLSPDEYHKLLRQSGFENIQFVAEDDECDGHSVLLATRIPD